MTNESKETMFRYCNTLRWMIGNLRAKFAATGDVAYYNAANRHVRVLRSIIR